MANQKRSMDPHQLLYDKVSVDSYSAPQNLKTKSLEKYSDIFDDTKQTPMSNKPVSFIYSPGVMFVHLYAGFTEGLHVLCKLSFAKNGMFFFKI